MVLLRKSYAISLPMQTVAIRTTQNVFIKYQLASLGDRLVATLIDGLIIISYWTLLFYILNEVKLYSQVARICLFVIPYLIYPLMFEIFMDGQTPGKKQMRIKVVRVDGTPANIGNFFIRWALGLVEVKLAQGMIAIVTIAMNGKGQRLGDIAGGTTVVKITSNKTISSEDIFTIAAEDHVAQFPSVINLTDEEIELIKQSLEVLERTSNLEPAFAVAEKVMAKLELKSDMPSIEMLKIMLKDYSLLTSQK
jgi:uncharacterized RDD family membrane protein YckC